MGANSEALRDFFEKRMSFTLHPSRRQAIEEECLIITEIEVIRREGPPEFYPFLLGGIPCKTTLHASPSEIVLEVDGKEVARIIGLPEIGSY